MPVAYPLGSIKQQHAPSPLGSIMLPLQPLIMSGSQALVISFRAMMHPHPAPIIIRASRGASQETVASVGASRGAPLIGLFYPKVFNAPLFRERS